MSCPDLGGTVVKIEPKGLAPSQWITTNGQDVVMESLTIHSGDGSFTKSFGEKTGLPTTVCTADHVTPHGTSEHAIAIVGLLPR